MSMLFRPAKIPARYRDLFEKIKSKGIRLDAMCNIYRGIWTGVLHVFVVTEDTVNEWNLENGALRRIIRGKDISPFGYQWTGRWVIYTNQVDFEKKYPNAIRYLEQYKMILQRRGAVWIYRKKWWELEEALDPKMFEVEKIISPYVSRFNAFAYDNKKFYMMDSTVIIRFWDSQENKKIYFEKWRETNDPKLDIATILDASENAISELNNSSSPMKYLLGILNSEIVEFYFKQYAQRLTKRSRRPPKGRYYLYIPPYLNVIPIAIGDKTTREEIISIVKNLEGEMEALIKVKNDPEKKEEREKLEIRFQETYGKLNEKVYSLYELDDKDVAMIQTFILKKR
ncbi:MAG: TaqI-like C-terminal specificity domain-containing protein [Candidatus Njordarchaeum guaymaensis]